MTVALGYYLNLYQVSEGIEKDVFIIFNEPNDMPTQEECEEIEKKLEKYIAKKSISLKSLKNQIRADIESMNLKCAEWGFQVIVQNLKTECAANPIFG